MADAVVFDADGTLFDTETLMHKIWVEVGQELNFTRPSQEYLDFVGLNRTALLALMAERYGDDFDGYGYLIRCVDRLAQHIDREGVPLRPGAREILEFLHERGIPAALATSTQRIRTDRRLELSGLAPYFQATITGDEVSKGKPDPEMYLTACQKLGVSPHRAIAVEDSRNGILSAHAAGMMPVMIPDMIPPTPELEALLFQKFNSLLDFRDYIASL